MDEGVLGWFRSKSHGGEDMRMVGPAGRDGHRHTRQVRTGDLV